jgi:hypothetical protein
MPILIRDPIDRIAHVFTVYCATALREMNSIQQVSDACETDGDALKFLTETGILPSDDPSHLKSVRDDIPRMKRCLERMWDIKRLARQVFAVNFGGQRGDDDAAAARDVFNQEVCFAYACKMLVSMGPHLQHFASRPTRGALVGAEIAIAMRTPIYVDDQRHRKSRLTLVGDAASTDSPAAKEEDENDDDDAGDRTDARASPPSVGTPPTPLRIIQQVPVDDDLACHDNPAQAIMASSHHQTLPRPSKQIRRSRAPPPARSCRG